MKAQALRAWTTFCDVGPGFLASVIIAAAAGLAATLTSGPIMLFALLFGLALTRRTESLDFLLSVVDEERTPTAVNAVESLAIYKNDPAVTARIGAAVDGRNDSAVAAEFQKQFNSRR